MDIGGLFAEKKLASLCVSLILLATEPNYFAEMPFEIVKKTDKVFLDNCLFLHYDITCNITGKGGT